MTADGVTHRGDVLELFDDLIDYEREPQPVGHRTPADHEAGKTSSHAAGVTVDDIFFGDSMRELPNGVNPTKKSKDHSEGRLDSLLDIPIEVEQGLPITVEEKSSLVKPSSSKEDEAREDRTSSESDSEEEIFHLDTGTTLLDYLAEYSDGSITP